MNIKRKLIICILMCLELFVIYSMYVCLNNQKVVLDDVNNKIKSNKNTFAILVEQSDGSYLGQTTFPTTGYDINEEKSGCLNKNGEKINNALEYDNNRIILNTGSTAQCYLYFDKLYTVSFDLDGGHFPNDETITLEVAYHNAYENLPTPIKDGYTFKGWNGKNLYNFDIVPEYNAATRKVVIDGIDAYQRKNNYSMNSNIWPISYSNSIDFVEGNSYTLSFNIWSNIDSEMANSLLFINDQTSTNHNISSIGVEKTRLIGSFVYSVGNNTMYHIYPKMTNQPEYYISEIQVEEGTTATEYEPYYIKTNTLSTRRENHTLKAIWEANN